MSASRAYQKAVIAALTADATVAGFVGTRIYDMAPADAAYPYVHVGEDSVIPADAECIDGEEITVTLHIWARDNGLLHPCKAIRDAVRKVFHLKTLSLDSPYANVQCYVSLAQAFMDPDGLTAHGVVQVTGMIETTA